MVSAEQKNLPQNPDCTGQIAAEGAGKISAKSSSTDDTHRKSAKDHNNLPYTAEGAENAFTSPALPTSPLPTQGTINQPMEGYSDMCLSPISPHHPGPETVTHNDQPTDQNINQYYANKEKTDEGFLSQHETEDNTGQPMAGGLDNFFSQELPKIHESPSTESVHTYHTDNTTKAQGEITSYETHPPSKPLKKVPPITPMTSSTSNQYAVPPRPAKIYHAQPQQQPHQMNQGEKSISSICSDSTIH